MALQLGATYVARGFSGDKTQLVPLIKGAIAHRGAAFIDVISPCVAFNNHAGSTRSYDYVREHNEAVNRIDFITPRAEITAENAPGEVVDVAAARRHACCACASCTPTTTRATASRRWLTCRRSRPRARSSTGLLYVDPDAADLHEALNTSLTPLNALDERELCPGAAVLDKINASLR